ncbi:MAG: hypothetical protein H0V15_02550 [Solirubrobacterales bacterium]|nr:hypothetical protein [Solirubrobacterales bacterium]
MESSTRGTGGSVRTSEHGLKAEAAKPSVSLKGVVKRFGDVTAVDGVDLDIQEVTSAFQDVVTG